MSRQFLIGLLDAGEIKYHKVGTHRRLQFEDVHAYRAKISKDSERALDELAALGQGTGGLLIGPILGTASGAA